MNKVKKSPSKKKYTFSIGSYGGEVAMGLITSDQYNYWNERSDDELKNYVMGWQVDQYEKDHKIPLTARMKNWFEYEDIIHTNGPEINDSQQLLIEEYDQDENLLKTWKPINLDAQSRAKTGIQISKFENYDANHKSLENKYYFWGRSISEGSWYIDKVELDEVLDLTKIVLHCSSVEGWILCSGIHYEGHSETLYFEENINGVEEECYVCEGLRL